jgi:hypothetical protein
MLLVNQIASCGYGGTLVETVLVLAIGPSDAVRRRLQSRDEILKIHKRPPLDRKA